MPSISRASPSPAHRCLLRAVWMAYPSVIAALLVTLTGSSAGTGPRSHSPRNPSWGEAEIRDCSRHLADTWWALGAVQGEPRLWASGGWAPRLGRDLSRDEVLIAANTRSVSAIASTMRSFSGQGRSRRDACQASCRSSIRLTSSTQKPRLEAAPRLREAVFFREIRNLLRSNAVRFKQCQDADGILGPSCTERDCC